MSKVITIRLEVKDGEDIDWMKEKIRAVLIDRNEEAHDSVDHFLQAFEPKVVWMDYEAIVWSLLVNLEDESGDATIDAYLREDPAQAHVSAWQFARNYLTWAQGPDWSESPKAVEWLESYRSE